MSKFVAKDTLQEGCETLTKISEFLTARKAKSFLVLYTIENPDSTQDGDRTVFSAGKVEGPLKCLACLVSQWFECEEKRRAK